MSSFTLLPKDSSVRKTKLDLFYYDECYFCQKVLREIERLDLKISFKHIYEDQKNLQALIDKTGRKTTPCLFINGEPMFESDDIIEWLRENHTKLDKNN